MSDPGPSGAGMRMPSFGGDPYTTSYANGQGLQMGGGLGLQMPTGGTSYKAGQGALTGMKNITPQQLAIVGALGQGLMQSNQPHPVLQGAGVPMQQGGPGPQIAPPTPPAPATKLRASRIF